MRAHTLPNRFRDNGVTPEILAELDSTPASMSDADRVLVEQIDGYQDTKNRKLSFRETGTEKGLTDKLAARIKSLEIAPNGDSPFGFSVETDINTDIGDLTDSGGGVIEEIIRAISTTTGQTFAFNLAQQFGHVTLMKSLTSSLRENGIPSIAFAVPNPGSLRLLRQDFANGSALPWRLLYEPGYCADTSLVLPMDPTHPRYGQTVLFASAVNRHILALAASALAHGHHVILCNDARHEGMALFKVLADWSVSNKIDSKLHTFHLGYTIFEPIFELLSDEVKQRIGNAREMFKDFYLGQFGFSPDEEPLPDGVDFMNFKTLAQLMNKGESESDNIKHDVLYQTGNSPEKLNLDMIPERLHEWFDFDKIIVIPEIGSSSNLLIKCIAITLGTSLYSESNKLIRQACQMALSEPETVISLIGKNTDLENVSRIVEKIPSNLHCHGIVDKHKHDHMIRGSDVIVTRTNRYSRQVLEAAVHSEQGIIILPDIPKSLGEDLSLFEVSLLSETLLEHANDATVAISSLKRLGIDHPEGLVWDPKEELHNQCMNAKRVISGRRNKLMLTPSDLASLIVERVSLLNGESRCP
uniref:Uncharacterized protein n=1 Tax=Candidatus Kentrum sp. LPFa TaxID=2126335 RepID=A0A450VTS5_9GAMM|nr:MAG: hypothetical protein BECKLPF1236A_GA0070988_100144 [Candidatus Kentron sp. LPFa]VFK24774.1 MAG: hypothetical protein BECKLPF1236C_GA0070990_100164 [Candidatus Kentron sp. LPFa]